jgi:hypothetical protein
MVYYADACHVKQQRQASLSVKVVKDRAAEESLEAVPTMLVFESSPHTAINSLPRP